MYKVEFEVVKQNELYRYSNENPIYYKNTTQTVPNSEIPDEHWSKASRETESPWDQYNNLKKWEEEDKGFVRNVKLYKMKSEPEWEEVNE